ncbi:AlpA family phage regulatory protein [Burkholderia sp. Bp9031]|uniref:helix-turn-helix transcriptional regulator n=1 Tax=Burkholderia sp. Bp9031 TaxID=2184566 RepID=UPI000F5FB14A|nr:AlpA family phage regulatory protein [Burkholderia sp. Bp9031]RQZ14039.1 AlpA family phage regulatory protein [Burkholderia sp. Bp9031]
MPMKTAVAGNDVPKVLPRDGFSRWNDLRPFVPLSRETVRKRELEGRFPRRVHLGSQRSVAWPNREIFRWIQDPANYRVEG